MPPRQTNLGPLPESSFIEAHRESIPQGRVTTAMARGRGVVRSRGRGRGRGEADAQDTSVARGRARGTRGNKRTRVEGTHGEENAANGRGRGSNRGRAKVATTSDTVAKQPTAAAGGTRLQEAWVSLSGS
jgi:hypothetical protein